MLRFILTRVSLIIPTFIGVAKGLKGTRAAFMIAVEIHKHVCPPLRIAHGAKLKRKNVE